MSKLNVPFYVSTNNKHLECLEVFVHIFNSTSQNKILEC